MVVSRIVLGVAASFVVACGDAPQPVRKPASSSPATNRSASAPVRFAGKATFHGDIAATPSARIFVIVRARGSQMPSFVRLYELDDVVAKSDGEHELAFEVTEANDMAGAGVPPGVDLELEVRFDRDGSLDSKSDVARAIAPVQVGEGAITLDVDVADSSGVAVGVASPSATATALRFAGRAELRAQAASAEKGTVFVIVRNRGTRLPLMVRAYDLADCRPAADGVRELAFEIDESTNAMRGLGGPVGADLELEVRFDVDGVIDTQGDKLSAIVPVEAGATDVEVIVGS